MMEILKKNMNILIIALYGYILFYKIKKDDYVSMAILTLFTAVFIMQRRKSSCEGFDKDGGSGKNSDIDKEDYVKKGISRGAGSGDKKSTGLNVNKSGDKKSTGLNKKKAGTANIQLERMAGTNENVKAQGSDDIKEKSMNMKLNEEVNDIKTYDDSIRIGAYDGLCLSSIQKKQNNELITNDELNTYYGHHLPQQAKKTSDDILTGPSIDGSEESPTKLAIFSNNKTSLNCCGDSPFSTTTGCVCLSEKQKKYIQHRGFNKQYEEL